MKKTLLVLGSASLGAALMAVSLYATYHYGGYVLLSEQEAMKMFLEILAGMNQAAQMGYEACKAGF